MPIILQLIICSVAGGILSLIGGLLLIADKKHTRLPEYATAFAAGALLASAFIDLLPEAIEQSSTPTTPAIFCLLGILIFFLLETFIGWFHNHNRAHQEPTKIHPIIPMAIIGDILHKLVDGIAIAAGFLISSESGVIVTLAVAAHEIPHEVGDFGLMLHHGISRKKVILINLLTSLTTTLSAVIFYLIGGTADLPLTPILALIAGFFIYIATSDIIPSIHSSRSPKTRLTKTITLLLGVTLVSLAIHTLHHLPH